MSPGEQEPAGQPVVAVKQPSDISSHVLGIGSTVLAGGRAFLGQGFTVMLLLFFFPGIERKPACAGLSRYF
jgi:hypothetical protein